MSTKRSGDEGRAAGGGRSRARFGRLLLALFGVLVALGLGEVVLRAAAPPADTPGLFLHDESAPLNTRGRPDASGIYAGVPVRLNSLGLRDREYAQVAEGGTLRVLVLGDSIAFGQGVARSEAWPKVLEARLGDEGLTGYDAVEVLNFGIPGYNTCQQYEQLSELGLAFEPDLVVVGFLYNDVRLTERERERWTDAPVSVAASGDAARSRTVSPFNRLHEFVRTRSLLFRVVSKRLASAARSLGFSDVGQVGSYKHRFADSDPDWAVVRSALRALRDLGRERGFEVLVVVTPAMAEMTDETYPIREYHDAVEAFCRGADIACLDLLPEFWGLDARQFHVSFLDGHPDATAHALIARAVERWLRAWAGG